MSDNMAVGEKVSGSEGKTSPELANEAVGCPVEDQGEGNGHMFQNYVQPEDSWGEVLTADDIGRHFCKGLPLVAGDGQIMTDPELRQWVVIAQREMERYFNLTLKITRFAARPSQEGGTAFGSGKIEGVDFDRETEPYKFSVARWRKGGHIQLRHRPIISVERAIMKTLTDNSIIDLKASNWVRLKKGRGVIWLFPRSAPGAVGSLFLGPSGLTTFLFTQDYEDAFHFDYTAGFKTASLVDEDLRAAIGKLATIGVLNIIGDATLAGFSSSSVSLDGINESFSSTQGVENALYGARINTYGKELKRWMETNRWKFKNIPLGMVGGG